MSSIDHKRNMAANILCSLRKDQHDLKQVLEGIPLPIFAIDTRHIVTCWNRTCEKVTGIPEKDILGRSDTWRGFYPQERPVLADLIVDGASERDIADHYGDRYIRSDVIPDVTMAEDFFPGLGTNGIWLFFSASPLRDQNGDVIGAIEILTDVTRCKEAERVSRENEQRYKQLFEQSVLGIIIADSQHRFLDVNPKAREILEYTREEMLGMYAEHLVHPNDQREVSIETNLRRMAAGESFRVERRFRKRDGGYIPVEVSLKRLEDGGSADHMVMFHDIVQRKRDEEKIYYLAYYNELTGLPNRRLFLDRLAQVVKQCDRTVCGGAVILLDIDRLRSVNDTLGPRVGDEYIVAIGERLRNAAGAGDMVAHMSGDEFMVLAESVTSWEEAHNMCRHILDAIKQPLILSSMWIYPEVSLGYTLISKSAANPDTLVKQTDIAMRMAKKDTEKIHGYVDQEEWLARQFHMEHELKHALENREFVIVYQAQMDLRTGSLCGLEALLRWRHPTRGLVSPADFIPVLERTGMITAADEWVIRNVCEQLRLWRDTGLHMKASVNISAKDFDKDMVLRRVGEALERTGLDGGYLEMELTETEILKNLTQASRILRQLSSWGISAALDDFGTGYSSMSYLQKLPINTIKIDKQFISGLPEDREAVTLVQTIISMAHNLGKKALAEGVEREEQRRILAELGCDYAQGFLWGRPQLAEDLDLYEN